MRDIFSPTSFIPFFLIYTFISILGMKMTKFELYLPTFLYVGAGLFIYYLGTKIEIHLPKNFSLLVFFILVSYYSYKIHGILGIFAGFFASAILYNVKRVESYKIYLLGFGITLLFLEIFAVGKIPLLAPLLRREVLNVFFYFALALIFFGANFEKKISALLTIASGIVLLLFGFRSFVLIFLLSIFLKLYYKKKLKPISFLIFGVVAFSILILGFLVVKNLPQSWSLSPLELLFYRFSFTFGVLNEIVRISGIFGITHGKLFTVPFYSSVVGEVVFQYKSHITATIFGPLILDGGIFELPIMGFFGAILNTLYKNMKKNRELIPYYSIFLSTLFVSAEINPFPPIFILSFLVLYRIEL